VQQAQHLIDNPVFRARAGAAMKQFADEFLTNQDLCAHAFENHFVEVIEGSLRQRDDGVMIK
jgi:hypothetical protein